MVTSLSWLLLLSLEPWPFTVDLSCFWWFSFAGLGAESCSTVRFVHFLHFLHRNLALYLSDGAEGTLQLLLDIIVFSFCLLLDHNEGPDLLIEIIDIFACVIQKH